MALAPDTKPSMTSPTLKLPTAPVRVSVCAGGNGSITAGGVPGDEYTGAPRMRVEPGVIDDQRDQHDIAGGGVRRHDLGAAQ